MESYPPCYACSMRRLGWHFRDIQVSLKKNTFVMENEEFEIVLRIQESEKDERMLKLTNMFRKDLLKHQREAFEWLLHQESSNDLPPFWEQREGRFVNVLNNFQTDTPPQSLRGGILYDGESLGMILPLLYLIASDKKDAVPAAMESASKPTLVLCSGASNEWVNQLIFHIKNDGALKFCCLHVSEQETKNIQELNTYDVVVTDFYYLIEKGTELEKLEWGRIILDEVDNTNTLRFTAPLLALNANRRWIFTKKAIPNEPAIRDFLVSFLQLEQYQLDQDNEEEGTNHHMELLLKAISLRRTLGTLIPPKIHENHYVELSPEDRKQYDKIKKEADDIWMAYNQSRNTTLLPYLETLIISLRQICCDSALCSLAFNPRDFGEDLSKNPDLKQTLLKVLKAADPDCSICGDPVTDAAITTCNHVFCRHCIWRVFKDDKPKKCPNCRESLSKSDVFSSTADSNSFKAESSRKLSTKADILIQLLKQSKHENPAEKSVIVSMFPDMLSTLEVPLNDAGFQTLCFERRMTRQEIAHVIDQFKGLEPTVLLASIKDAIWRRLNLVDASITLYFMEANKEESEKKAVHNLYTFGKVGSVKIVRLITKNSIEENMLMVDKETVRIRRGFGGWSTLRCPDPITLGKVDFILKEL